MESEFRVSRNKKSETNETENSKSESIPPGKVKFTKTQHNSEPDYARSTYKFSPEDRGQILESMIFLYGEDVAEAYMPELERIIKIYYAHKPEEMINNHIEFDPENRFTEEDVILITYGDILHGNERSPLATLAKFCDTFLKGTVNTLHLLPFFPYSSDRGFSVIDFESVDPRLGTWDDIEDLESRYQLMFDGVVNHISSKSRWFQEFLDGSPYYKDFFIAYKSPEELAVEDRSKIFRPRTSDVLVKFDTIEGPRYVWATFSPDQIDLNYKNPNVLIRVLDILLMYVRHGADIIRLDAVTFLWSEPGTQCIHLEETHEIIRLYRNILDIVSPGVALITETNVPHEENISYFGNGHDEAHMVYNFALPPLVLYTFYKEDATVLSNWAEELKTPSKATTFFNFLDSHDGIGLMGVKNLLSKEEIGFIIKRAEEHGGFISYKTGESGVEEPYEVNITWYSALNQEDSDEDIAFQVKRFVASRTISIVLKGVPGIYLHSLIGTRNDIEAVLKTRSKRDINRTVISSRAIYKALEDPFSRISRINRELGRLISIRTKKRAFHPNGEQHILRISPKVFSVYRISPEGDQHILSLVNVTNEVCHVEIPLSGSGLSEFSGPETVWIDIAGGMERVTENKKLFVVMQPYDVIWLEPLDELSE